MPTSLASPAVRLPLPDPTARLSSSAGLAKLARLARTARLNRWAALVAPLALLAWWVIATRRAASGADVGPMVVAPSGVAAAARELLASGELGSHLAASLRRLGFGFGAGAGLGLLYGVLIGVLPTTEGFFAPTFNAIRQVPSIAFIPMLILMFGVEETFKIVLVAKATFFPVALATAEGVRGVPPAYLEVARVYRLRGLQLARLVLLPAIVPPVVTGVRIALGRSWMVLVTAEILAAESGLGQMMERGRQMFRLDVVLVGVLFTSLAGIAIERGMRALEGRLGRWRRA